MTFISLALLLKSKVDLFLYPPHPPTHPHSPTHRYLCMHTHHTYTHTHARTRAHTHTQSCAKPRRIIRQQSAVSVRGERKARDISVTEASAVPLCWNSRGLLCLSAVACSSALCPNAAQPPAGWLVPSVLHLRIQH